MPDTPYVPLQNGSVKVAWGAPAPAAGLKIQKDDQEPYASIVKIDDENGVLCNTTYFNRGVKHAIDAIVLTTFADLIPGNVFAYKSPTDTVTTNYEVETYKIAWAKGEVKKISMTVFRGEGYDPGVALV
jgi:hypothetical protein